MNLSYPQRLLFLAALAACGVALILMGLFDLQIVDHDRWDAALQYRSSLSLRVHGERGRILDADGEILARDVLGYDLMVVTAGIEGFLHECRRCGHHMSIRPGPRYRYTKCPVCRTRDDAAGPVFRLVDDRQWKPVADLIGWSEMGLYETVKIHVDRNIRTIDEELAKAKNLSGDRKWERRRYLQRKYGWQPVRVKADVPYEVAREVALHPERNPGFRIHEGRVRRNVGGAGFAALIGRKPDPFARAQGAHSGSGLELVLDPLLSGEVGAVEKVRDKKGVFRVVETDDPVDGVSVELTMTRRDQEAALAAFDDRAGALVVVNAETGAVLALASAPSYRPEDFNEMYQAATEAQKAAKKNRTPEYQVPPDPRINRALRGWYPPGSTMKPFTALAGLRLGTLDPAETVDCHRQFTLNGKTHDRLRCNSTHGPTDLRGALVHSCNIYFQTVMHHMLSADAESEFESTGHAFGFGEPTGIELESERWLRDMTFRLRPRQGRAPYGMRLQHAIGQGYLTATPAQVARAYAALLTGRLPKLHIVQRRGTRRTVPEHTPLEVAPSMLQIVREALRATNDPGNSLAKYGLDRYEMGAKTGTAQTKYLGLHFAWLAGFVDARGNRPPIAFAMVVEYSNHHGGDECAPRIARFLAEFYGENRPQ